MAGARSRQRCASDAGRPRDPSRVGVRIAFDGPTLSRYLSESVLSGSSRLAKSVAAGALALLIVILALDLAVLTLWAPIVSARAYPVKAVEFGSTKSG